VQGAGGVSNDSLTMTTRRLAVHEVNKDLRLSRPLPVGAKRDDGILRGRTFSAKRRNKFCAAPTGYRVVWRYLPNGFPASRVQATSFEPVEPWSKPRGNEPAEDWPFTLAQGCWACGFTLADAELLSAAKRSSF